MRPNLLVVNARLVADLDKVERSIRSLPLRVLYWLASLHSHHQVIPHHAANGKLKKFAHLIEYSNTL